MNAPADDAPSTTFGICESCGGAEPDLVRVRRYYVTPAAWDTDARVQPAGEEVWCFVCRTHYPHQLLDGDDPADSAAGPSDAPA